jgi:DNA (cytosine-5)-methyltransferase 1
MENVLGLLSSKPDPKKDPIFARILDDLAAPAESEDITTTPAAQQHRYKLYSLSPRRTNGEPAGSEFVLRADEHGVPQARHRVIIVGVRDDFSDEVPDSLKRLAPVPISKVLKQMPALRGRITDKKDSDTAWLKLFSEVDKRRWFKSMGKFGPDGISELATKVVRGLAVPAAKRGGEFIACTPDIAYCADWFLDSRLQGVCNHSSRAHITKDLYRYFFAACYASVAHSSPKIAEFPTDLLPHHKNIPNAILKHSMFLDRFRVQPWSRPATTVTSHISKDGHYYIHPDPMRCRSLTVREVV